MNKPDKIIVPFEYENHVKTSYYCLELEESIIERVELGGILTFLECADTADFLKISVAYWEPTQNGWKVIWRVTGAEFLDIHELKEIV